jgi:hypothetical protein
MGMVGITQGQRKGVRCYCIVEVRLRVRGSIAIRSNEFRGVRSMIISRFDEIGNEDSRRGETIGGYDGVLERV